MPEPLDYQSPQTPRFSTPWFGFSSLIIPALTAGLIMWSFDHSSLPWFVIPSLPLLGMIVAGLGYRFDSKKDSAKSGFAINVIAFLLVDGFFLCSYLLWSGVH